MINLLKYWFVGMMWIIGVVVAISVLYWAVAFLAQSTLGVAAMVIAVISIIAVAIGGAAMNCHNLDYPIRTAEDDLADAKEEHF